MATQGAKTVGDFLRLQPLYTLEGHAGLIKCPTLVVDCEGDFASQGDKLYAALTCEKKLLKLDADSGAGGHCGGLGQRSGRTRCLTGSRLASTDRLAGGRGGRWQSVPGGRVKCNEGVRQ